MAEVRPAHIFKAYARGVRITRDLSLGVRDYDVLALVGPLGCGKGTALRRRL